MNGLFTTGKNVLLPADDGARKLCQTPGETLYVEAEYDRDMIFHRRVFAVINELAKATGQTPDWMRAQLLVYAGLFNVVGTFDTGKPVIAVKSMSKRSMTDEELHAFWKDAQEAIAEKVLPRVADPDLREALARDVAF